MFEYLVDVEILKRSRNICSPSHLSSKQAIAGLFFTVYLISVYLDQCFLDTFIIPAKFMFDVRPYRTKTTQRCTKNANKCDVNAKRDYRHSRVLCNRMRTMMKNEF